MQTQKGILGSVSKPGDLIMVLCGGQVPIVLRPCGGNEYSFVCECYVHGFMDGEAFVEAGQKNDPEYDGQDRSWLKRLHEAMPFPTQEFILV